jgi:hypothetical protein
MTERAMCQLDATVVIYYHKYLYMFRVSTVYAHLQEYRLYATAYCVQN